MSRAEGIYRRTPVALWRDRRFRNCGKSAQLLYLQLRTGPLSCAIPGVVVAGPATLGEEFDLSPDEVRGLSAELAQAGLLRADWEARLLWLPDVHLDDPPANPSIVRGWSKYWGTLPECSLRDVIASQIRSVVVPRGTAFATEIDTVFGTVSNPTPDGVEHSVPDGVPDGAVHRIRKGAGKEQDTGEESPPNASEARKEKSNEGERLGPTITEVVNAWNTEGPRLPRARKGGPQRDRHLQARLRADPERQTIAWWTELVRRIDASPFLRGEGPSRDGRRSWRADIDWVLSSEDHITRIVEGRYDSAPSRPEPAYEYLTEADMPFGGPRGDR